MSAYMVELEGNRPLAILAVPTYIIYPRIANEV
jgi:hypothetical protein